jgi:L-iditol 2-dehydrogenase
MMRAVQFDGNGLIPIERHLRKPLSHEVLIRVQACGICGTDIKILNGESDARPPVILGHEFYGIVEDTGSNAPSFKPGDIISVDPNIVCGKCLFCRKGKANLCTNLTALGVDIDGGFATHCYVPDTQCYTLPGFLRPEQAVLIEPLSCALYGFQKAGINAGDSVAIVGGGIIGVMMLKLARLSPAKMIILLEPDENRRMACLSLGSDAVFDPNDSHSIDTIKDVTQGGADCVIECAGSISAVKTAITLLNRGGHLVLFGVTNPEQQIMLSPYNLFKNDISVCGSFLNPGTFQSGIDLIQTKKLTFDDVDIHTFPLTQIDHGIDNQRKRKSLKTVITMNS